MGKDIFRGPLEQVDNCCWRIPKSFKQGMRVDGLIFASERLLEQIKQDQAPDQVANVAFLPGIQHASLAMPDIHWGYGFCIGGVCATDPDDGGVISPGGVGYDINCFTYDTPIVNRHGYSRPIGELADDWQLLELSCHDLTQGQRISTTACRWFGRKPHRPLLRLRTESGDSIRATSDHPFWTPEGMVPLEDLAPGDRVAMAPFEGVPYEAPTDEVIVSLEVFTTKWAELGMRTGGRALEQAVRYLTERGLLPLHYCSPALPYLCKLLGFIFGDGSLHFVKQSSNGVVSFYGQGVDLETIRADVQALGIIPSRVYRRDRHHCIQTPYAEVRFDRQEEWFKVGCSSFTVLLACLGAPVGNKACQDYDAPAWLDAAPLWQKRLFLAALFGAELTTPATITGNGTVFTSPTLCMSKRISRAASGRRFLRRLSDWLKLFGVETQAIAERTEQMNKDGERSVRLRLILSPKAQILHHLWARVGYEYNRKRSGLAALAIQYLKHKQHHLAERAEAAESIRALLAQGTARQDIFSAIGSTVNHRFMERVLYGKASNYTPRVAVGFPTFADFCRSAQAGGEHSGMVWERIAAIEPVDDYHGLVYDFTVNHPDHNFIANGFVVSNCGVRLIRSNLFYRDVKPHLRTLVEELFRNVPTGVGRSGRFKFEKKELQHLLAEGPRYLTGRGLTTPSDLERTEANGRLDGAQPDKVSDHALMRGAEQCGTLGSGNHFLEVQVVDHVFDEEAAQVMGLEKDMICVMVHSGSRGLGYQVCDDALVMLRNAPKKYGIDLPDRQLACAPIDSPEGQHYIGAMRAAANFAWCNRQLLMQQAREVFASVFGRSWQELQMNLIYDVCHNIAKFEEHVVDGKRKKVWVHRKGATRAFPPEHPEIPAVYRTIGQPVIIPGDMGRASWVLVGQPGSMQKTFGTTCHGAGRAMSRTASVKEAAGRRIDKELEARGVIARAQSRKGLAEEQPKAYKNVDDVVAVVDQAGLSTRVARMRPIGVIKG
jgi:tRNA-splicing ligase RtcB (3'-phosphate/5'-hydroxy nucleic acid ligase)